jgi:7-carboxy-7-deazaguanine synthase
MIDKLKDVYRYSEIFYSIQGEGRYSGTGTLWCRFFLCNLQCDGFMQKDPTDPRTYDLPYLNIDPKEYASMEDLPVFDKGCDSSYSWSKKYKHLQRSGTAAQIAERITHEAKTESNPTGLFKHPNGSWQHLCFTGGEPLMKHGQKAVPEILNEYKRFDNLPKSVTFETNGTQPLSDDFKTFFSVVANQSGPELFFSISPKLHTVSGEKKSKAIKLDTIAEYHKLSSNGQLKFVLGEDELQWEEMEDVLSDIRKVGVKYPVWIMPVGALAEQQQASAGKIAEKAFKRGYNVSARVHCYLWGNTIGV